MKRRQSAGRGSRGQWRRLDGPKVAVALAFCSLVGVATAVAYLTDGDEVRNQFSVAADLEVRVVEDAWDGLEDSDGDGVPDAASALVPGQTLPKDPAVANLEGTEAYLFCRVGVPVREVVTATASGALLERAPTELFSWTTNEGWTEQGVATVEDDMAWHVFLYQDPVAVGERTSTLFDQVTYANVVEGQVDGDLTLAVQGYGIQALGFADAGEAYAAFCAQNEGDGS